MTTWARKEVHEIICNILENQGFITTQQLRERCSIIEFDAMRTKRIGRYLMPQRTANRWLREIADKKLISSKKVGKTWRWIPSKPIDEIRCQLACRTEGQ